MLWNLVFDFFVQHIFGGFDSTGAYYFSFVGVGVNYTIPTADIDSSFAFINLSNNTTYNLNLGSYLSLIATIITMVALVIFSFILVKKIISIFVRVFSFGA